MTKPLRLSLQICGEMPEEKRFELIGFLEAKIQETVGPNSGVASFEFRDEDVTHTASADASVRVTLLCLEVGSLGPCELTTIMGSLAQSEVVAGEYGVAFPSPSSAKLTPKAQAA